MTVGLGAGAVVKKSGQGRFSLGGILSFLTVPDLLAETETLFKESGDVLVDLSEVIKSDSAGVALLVEWMNEAHRQNQEIQFLDIPSQMLGLVRVSGLDQVLPLHRGLP